MDTGRVGACHRLENKRRKFLIVVNDVVQSRYDVDAEYIRHMHDMAEHRFEKSKMFVRRALVRQKVLQKCMKMRRRELQPTNVYGRYGGKPIDSFSRDIEGFIAHNHPRLRRKRYLERLLEESREKGAILKQSTVKNRVSGWLERSYTKYKLQNQKREKTNLDKIEEEVVKASDRRQSRIPKLPVLTQPFYLGGSADQEPETNTPREVDVLTITRGMGNVTLTSSRKTPTSPGVGTPERRNTLVLPPIKSTKTLVETKS